MSIALSDEDLRRAGMTQKVEWAGAPRVGPGLDDPHDVIDLGRREVYSARENIERGAEGTDHVGHHVARVVELGEDGDWKVAAQRLAEVPGRGQVMVHASVRDHERLAARGLHIDDTCDIDARRTYEEAAGLHDESSAGEQRITHHRTPQRGEALTQLREIERLLCLTIRDAEAAAEIDRLQRPAEPLGKPPSDGDAGPVL